jgi:outer membrane immunogenic protein
MIKTVIAASAVLLAGLPIAALAQEAPRAYGALGYSQFSTDGTDLGAVTGRIGYKLWPNFGMEAEASIGVDDQAYDVSIGGSSGVFELKHDVAAYAVAFLPLGDHVELFARVGHGSTNIEASTPSVTVREGDGESLNYGVGASVFLDNNGLRADWTRRDFANDAGKADVWSVSYIRRF